MTDIIVSIISLIVGSVITLRLSKYYYKRSIDKKLSIYYLTNSSVLSGINPDIISRLSFKFDNVDIESLQTIIFVVVNDGDKSVSGIIDDLSLEISENSRLLDVSVIYKEPENLLVDAKIKGKNIRKIISFPFPILNKGEYFVVKLLVDGYILEEELCFNIVAEDLPRKIKIKHHEAGIKFEETKPSEFRPFSIDYFSIIPLLIFCWFGYITYILYRRQNFEIPNSIGTLLNLLTSIIVVSPTLLISILALFIFLGMILGSFSGGQFPPLRKLPFILPEKLRSSYYPFP